MTDNQLSLPARDELELSIFGPGFGEAILLHIGDGKWVLVDSCLDPGSGQPASLTYLHNLNVDIGQAVKLVVATHWHDDHVRGIANLFEQCQSADFVISNALRNEEFLALTSLYRAPSGLESSGLDEFSKIFQLLTAQSSSGVRFNSPKFAVSDKSLYRTQIEATLSPTEARVFALSPSDESILQATLAFAELMKKEEQRRKRVASPAPNHTSVVLWAEVGHHRILLGADLEKTSNPKTGWSVIVEESTVISGKASLFKVPHHGSENAHHDGVWSEVLLNEPFAILTPYSPGRKPLPSDADITRISRLTPNVYVTSPTKRQRIRWRQRIVKEYVEQVTRSIRSIHHGWGQVRLRKRIDETSSSWQVELFGDAYVLKE